VVVGAVCFAVEAADAGGFLVAVGAHVGVVVVSAAARGFALLPTSRFMLRRGFLGVDCSLLVPFLLRVVGDDTSPTQVCRFGGAAQGGAVGALAP